VRLYQSGSIGLPVFTFYILLPRRQLSRPDEYGTFVYSLCRAGALLTLIALISSDMSEPAAARGVAAIGRVQTIRVVPRIPVQPRTLHGNIAPQQVFRLQKQAVLGKRFGTIISAEQGPPVPPV
jgi:hypothetical protein